MGDALVKAVNGKQGFVKLTTKDIPAVGDNQYMSTEDKLALGKLEAQTRDLRTHTFGENLHVDKDVLAEVKASTDHLQDEVVHFSKVMKKKLNAHLDKPHDGRRGLRGFRGYPGPQGDAAGGLFKHTQLTDMPSAANPDHDARYLNLSGANGNQDFIDFNIAAGAADGGEGRVKWNTVDKTLDVTTGLGPILQLGQEFVFKVYNNTGAELTDGKVVHPTGGVTGDGTPHVTYAKADTFINCFGTLAVITSTIAIGEFGFATRSGKVRGIDTSLLGTGFIYLSATVAGDLINVAPEFPHYSLLIGGVGVSDLSDGNITVSITNEIIDTLQNAYNGVFRESFDFRITSAGGVITGKLRPTNGHDDMTMMFSSGFALLPTDVGEAEIDLTAYAGPADDTPATCYVYIPESTRVLTASNSDWPTTVEHIRVAQLFLQTPAGTAIEGGALRNQNWNDHIADTDTFQGHSSHIGQRMRAMIAEWDSGSEATMTISGSPDDVFVAVTSGKVYQMHQQTFPAQDMALGDTAHIVNDSITPYTPVVNLNDALDLDALGNSTQNKWFSIVVWGVANKTDEISHVMINLPLAGYTSEASAVSDADGNSVYNIPKAFKGVGFLIARFTIRRSTNTFTYNIDPGYQDLRGFFPNTTAGVSGGSAGITTFLALTDTPPSYAGDAGKVAAVNGGESAIEFVDITKVGTINTGVWEATDVGVAHGGTGKSSWTQYLIPYAATATSFGQIPIGTNGHVLTSNGPGSAPSFQVAGGGGGGAPLSAYTNKDSDDAILTNAHSYLAVTDGIIYCTDDLSANEYMKVYVSTIADPVANGLLIIDYEQGTNKRNRTVSAHVAAGEYFECTLTSGNTTRMFWKSFGTLGHPVDQEPP